jgi:RNA polymerase sigma factor (sigma-70 family)
MARGTVRSSEGIPPFQVFLDEHRAVVYRFLVASVGPHDADDCFQETFLSALRAYPKLEDARNLRGWVLAIAARKAIDAGRARARRPLPVAELPEDAGGHADTPAVFDPVWDAVRGLPPRQRVALVHRVVLDRSYAETAAAMGGSEEGARANVYQALKRLRSEVRDR